MKKERQGRGGRIKEKGRAKKVMWTGEGEGEKRDKQGRVKVSRIG